MSIYTTQELRDMGVQFDDGAEIRVSRKASLYGAERIRIGNHTRIDDFAVLSAGSEGIYIGRHVHIAVFVSLIGRHRIVVGDFVGLSGRVSIYSATDDFSGNFMTGPTIPEEYTNIAALPVYVGRHVVVGTGSVILPGAKLSDGCAVGAMSLVKGTLEPFVLYGGIPAKAIRKRNRKFLEMEQRLNASEGLFFPNHHEPK